MSTNPLPLRSPLAVAQADFPDHAISQRSIRGKLFYVAEARRPGIRPEFAQAETAGRLRAKLQAAPVNELNTSQPSIARVYDALLGGKDNFTADRIQADKLLDVLPYAGVLARESRRFQARAVAHVARRGVRQFLDIGCGLPAAPNTHESARLVRPGAVVVYVDHDDQVLIHARGILARTPGVLAIDGDVGYPDEILYDWRIRDQINFYQPVCIVLTMILHFFPARTAQQIITQLSEGIPDGSYLIVSVGYLAGEAGNILTRDYQPAHVHHHTRHDVASFLSGLQLVPPGVTEARTWHAPAPRPDRSRAGHVWAAVGQKVTPVAALPVGAGAVG
jgi:SAM-dependent methyltransferase